ncbi:MAG TPA: CBS domain-containing protein [Actinomycetota bacterium]|nr:CBS domain-containing protein [Actinomycetota bacterium]
MKRQEPEIDRLLGTVDQVMQRRVAALHPEAPVGDAVRELERAGVSGGPVVESGRVVGMVSFSDLFEAVGVPRARVSTSGPWHRFEHWVGASPLRVRDVMTRHVVILQTGTPLSQAAEAMWTHGVNRIPIVTPEGTLVGIVARDDVIRAVAEAGRRSRAVPAHPGASRMEPDP